MSCSPFDSSAMLHRCFHTNSLSRPKKHFSPHSQPALSLAVTSERFVSRCVEGGGWGGAFLSRLLLTAGAGLGFFLSIPSFFLTVRVRGL